MNEHSSFNAAFGLASVLKDRGHEPVFFVDDETVFSRYVSGHGFKSAFTPTGHEPRMARPMKTSRLRLWTRLRNRAENIRVEQEYLANLIKSNSLDLCFLDAIRYDLYPFALALVRAGIPTLLLSPTFASGFGTGHPPVFSSVSTPRATRRGIASGAMNTLRWSWALATRGHRQAFDRAEYLRIILGKWLDQMRNVSFDWKLRRLGCRSAWSEYKRRPLIPEIVFGHRAMDWPALASDPYRCYFGSTDRFRPVAGFDWPVLESGKPVIYCNLSTINGFENIRVGNSEPGPTRVNLSRARFRMAKRYVDAVVDCFSRRTDWQLLVACGPFYPSLKSQITAPNIHLFERLPQFAVLQKADLAITWGGAGTIRECISLGVPLVVLPAWTDQFGNAARVAACNIGVRGDLGRITTGQLEQMIERVLGDGKVASSIAALRDQGDAGREVSGVVEFVQRHAGLRL